MFGRKWQGTGPGSAGVVPQIRHVKGQAGHLVKVRKGIWVTTLPYSTKRRHCVWFLVFFVLKNSKGKYEIKSSFLAVL